MEDLIIKFNLLEAFQRKEVMALINGFLKKQPTPKPPTENRWKEHKESLLKVSVWSDEDIEEIYSNQVNGWKWTIQEW